MKSDAIIQLHKNFEDYAHQIDGEEFWFARDLQASRLFQMGELCKGH